MVFGVRSRAVAGGVRSGDSAELLGRDRIPQRQAVDLHVGDDPRDRGFALSSCSSPFDTVAANALISPKLFTWVACTCASSFMSGACFAMTDAVRIAAARTAGPRLLQLAPHDHDHVLIRVLRQLSRRRRCQLQSATELHGRGGRGGSQQHRPQHHDYRHGEHGNERPSPRELLTPGDANSHSYPSVVPVGSHDRSAPDGCRTRSRPYHLGLGRVKPP